MYKKETALSFNLKLPENSFFHVLKNLYFLVNSGFRRSYSELVYESDFHDFLEKELLNET